MYDFRNDSSVAIAKTQTIYPDTPPFHPSMRYPEFPNAELSDTNNQVFAAVRQLFWLLGFDRENFNTPAWNPLGDIINKGETVLIKPNLVRHFNPLGYNADSLITHGSVIRAVVDYVLLALQGTGQLIIGDAPLQSCDFQKAIQANHLAPVLEYYRNRGIDIPCRDFRLVKMPEGDGHIRKAGTGDPAGFTFFDLGTQSLHYGDPAFNKFRVTNYDPAFMQEYQNENNHVYIIANTVLDADVVISIPKLKTHRKSGITVAMKNNIGINAHKDCLPHHKRGSVAEGGDEYLNKSFFKDIAVYLSEFEDRQNSPLINSLIAIPKRIAYALAARLGKDKYFEGSWWGNNTIPKTLIDLNNILLFGNKETFQLEKQPVRKFLAIVDGIVGGEGEGPLEPTPIEVGLLLAGRNPVAVDLVSSHIMGFDWRKIPFLVVGIKFFCNFEPESVECFSTTPKYHGSLLTFPDKEFFHFTPTSGWLGHIERDV